MVQEANTLRGRTVAVTRPREQAKEAGLLIERRGGKPFFLPTIEIKGTRDLSAVKKFVEALGKNEVDYVIFMSVNGVQQLFEAAEGLGLREQLTERLNATVTMAVGPKTAEALESSRIRVRVIPEKYTSEGIVQSLKLRGAFGKTIYIPRTSQAPPELAEKLREMGNRVQEIHVYESQLPRDHELNAQFLRDLKRGKIDAVVFSSALGAKNLIDMLKEACSPKELIELIKAKTVIVAIGPTTAKMLSEMGLSVDVMPEKHLFEEALDALALYWTSN